MNDLTGDIANLVFVRKIDPKAGTLSLDIQLLNVLMLLDGSETMAMVARKLNIRIAELREYLIKLNQLNLIGRSEKAIPAVDNDFFDELEKDLIDIMGPIAGALIDDTINLMRAERNSFPRSRATELVELLASKILIEEKRIKFLEDMKAKMLEGNPANN